MSQWDFGYGREPTEHHEPQYPQQAPYPYPEDQGAGVPARAGLPVRVSAGTAVPVPARPPGPPGPPGPPEPQYQYPQAPPGQQYPPAQPAPDQYAQDPDYPYPYTPQPAEPDPPAYPPDQAGWADNGGWPGADGHPGYPGGGEPYDPPDAYPITYERDGFEGRASLPAAPQPDVTHAVRTVAGRRRAGRAVSAANRRRISGAPRPRSPTWVPRTGRGCCTRASSRATQTVASLYRRPGRPGDRRTPAGAAWRPGGGPWPDGDEGEWGDEPADRGRWLIPGRPRGGGRRRRRRDRDVRPRPRPRRLRDGLADGGRQFRGWGRGPGPPGRCRLVPAPARRH